MTTSISLSDPPPRGVSFGPTTPGQALAALTVPERATESYEELAAWYSGFSFCEHFRKVTQSQCMELVRARFAADGEKVTEARIEALARLEPAYLDYLTKHLIGRIAWEREFLKQGGMR